MQNKKPAVSERTNERTNGLRDSEPRVDASKAIKKDKYLSASTSAQAQARRRAKVLPPVKGRTRATVVVVATVAATAAVTTAVAVVQGGP